MGILDLFFPKYCVNCKKIGDFLCSDCFSRLSFDTKNICLVCGNPSYDGLTHPGCIGRYTIDGSFTGVVFNSISKKLIYQFKYKPHLSSLSSFLGELLYESLIQDEEFNKILHSLPPKAGRQNDMVLVPIPLSSKRYKKRGYNQAEILAKELSKKFGFPVFNCLIRIKETRTQVGLSKKDRKKNVEDVFAIARGPVSLHPRPTSSPDAPTAGARRGSPALTTPRFSLEGKNVILVDDVLTTGATMSEASSILKRNGAAKVWAIAFAKEQ
ncbi:MAG: Phosphoribosyltransferase [Microgenomates group bacterium GW2011_GWA2_37_6]|nr:MAG: Phosphoribosyltransferase [Microgenomates group bacterium GW2011_GWA2_37_6]